MLIEAARRAETAAREMLTLLNSGTASCAQAREVLAVCKSTAAVVAAAQTSAAKLVAGVEGHGDGGVQVLADTAGLTRRDALGQVKTARVIEAAPVVETRWRLDGFPRPTPSGSRRPSSAPVPTWSSPTAS